MKYITPRAWPLAWPLAVLLLSACSSGPQPVEPGGGPEGSGPFRLLDGPYASVDEVPLPESQAFTARLPEKLVLTNGLNVLLQRDPVLPLVELRLYLDAGTWDDPRGRTGVAEMTARVMREGGGSTWPAERLDEELAFLGASLEVDTSPDGTTARLRCLAEDFEAVLGMLEDIVRAPAFPEEVVERVRGRMRAEVLARDDRSPTVASREALRALYGRDDPRVRRLELADLEAITRDDLVAYHRRHVGARRALIAVHGDLQRDAAATELDRRFGDWGGQIADAREVLPPPTAPETRRIYHVDRPDLGQAEIRLLAPGIPLQHPDRPALLLAGYVLGDGGFGSRMMQRIRVQLGLAYGVGARWETPAGRPGLFRAATATRSDAFGRTLAEMLTILDDLLAKGIDGEELAAAQARWSQSQVFRVDTPAEVLWRTAELERRGLAWDFHDKTDAAVLALDAATVVETVRRHLDPARLLIFVVGDLASFDRPPADFGIDAAWDLKAAGGGTTRDGVADPDGADAAVQLAARVLAQHGGAEVWSAVRAVAVEAELGGAAKRVLMSAPDRMCWTDVASGAVELVLAGDAAWRPAGGPALTEAQRARLVAVCQAELPILLMRLARGGLTLESPAEGVLVVVDEAGRRMRLDLGADGLVRRITIDDQVQEFSDYALQSGVMLPGRLRQTDTGAEAFETALTAWDTRPEFDEALFLAPR